jgi:hypothetical protein
MKEHPLSPLADAMQSSVAKGASYFLAWVLGVGTPRVIELTIFRGITGHLMKYQDDESSVGVVSTMLITHPIGFLILASHIVIFAFFVRFPLRYVWALWPLTSGIFWRIFIEHHI